MLFSEQDKQYMARALELAERGMGFTSPNPMVGAVIVKDGRVIGEGWHEKFGELHAERNALANCTDSPEGATIYVSLEPCCHYGKTPPCTEALVEAGISRVVIGSSDPNPLVAGKGIEYLREHGITVEGNLLEEQALALNEPFFHFITTGKPLVVLKYAMTMDGKIATRTGESRWITGEEARERVHRDRMRYASIMVGVGTVITDDPMLTSHIDGGHDPIRIVCDTMLRTSLDSKLVQSARDVRTIIATCQESEEAIRPYEEMGCQILQLPEVPVDYAGRSGRVDLKVLVEELGKMNIDSVMIEGGATLAWSALDAQIIDKVQTYIAPKFFGGADAPSPVSGEGISHPDECVRLVNSKMQRIGEDFLIESEVEYCSRES
ncbi:MAG: bifunctional diaminohydroxyphosphoribosylaminopyrimidine deaminase/5-amino-6-(5-phosphoribosylamino)uracil reductase RibD [Coriobacteriales bacterium]